MSSPFDDHEVDRRHRPSARGLAFDLEAALESVVVLYARVPDDAYTARTLGGDRLGNGIVIDDTGLVLTIGYLVIEAEDVTLMTNDGRRIYAHVLGYDQATGFGLVQALEPLHLPALPIGDSRQLDDDDEIILAGGGGLAHAMAGQLVARAPFAGTWEYYLKEALFTRPGHPHWSGAGLIGPGGELMGVCSLQMNQQEDSGRTPLINMSVPIELLPPILEDMASGQPFRAPRPWLGVTSQDYEGRVVIVDVSDGGPAARAELRPGDYILAVAGEPVHTLADFYTRLWAIGPAGTVAKLRLQREDDIFNVEVRTGDRASRLKTRRFN